METNPSLTYQPFANVPTLDKLREDLYRNVAQPERMISLLSGAAAVLAGLRKRSPLGVVMALAGSALLLRGASGHCPMYTALGKTAVHSV